MIKLNQSQFRGFIRKKTSNSQIISVVCGCLLSVVNGNVSVSVPNLNNFEKAYKFSTNSKMILEKKQSITLSK